MALVLAWRKPMPLPKIDPAIAKHLAAAGTKTPSAQLAVLEVVHGTAERVQRLHPGLKLHLPVGAKRHQTGKGNACRPDCNSKGL